MSPKRLWFVTHCLACRYLSVFWMQRSWQCWGVLLENTANVCTHATGTEQEPIFLVWRATGEVLQMERSEWCITISAWLSSVGVFILWRVCFWWKSQYSHALALGGTLLCFQEPRCQGTMHMYFLPLSQSRVCESLEEFTVHGLQNYSNKSI
jgi:hypothetical protein